MCFERCAIKATIASDGSLLIESLIVNETISLKTAAAEPQTYFLGTRGKSKVVPLLIRLLVTNIYNGFVLVKAKL
jgi:hypothetical protein